MIVCTELFKFWDIGIKYNILSLTKMFHTEAQSNFQRLFNKVDTRKSVSDATLMYANNNYLYLMHEHRIKT